MISKAEQVPQQVLDICRYHHESMTDPAILTGPSEIIFLMLLSSPRSATSMRG